MQNTGQLPGSMVRSHEYEQAHVFRDLLFTGSLGGFLSARPGFAETLIGTLNNNDDARWAPEHNSKDFWTNFVAVG